MGFFNRLLPRQVAYFDLFEQHAAITVKAAQALALWAHGEPLPAIKPLEREADHIVHMCMDALNKTFITPIERLDIHRLITALDDIADRQNVRIGGLHPIIDADASPLAQGQTC